MDILNEANFIIEKSKINDMCENQIIDILKNKDPAPQGIIAKCCETNRTFTIYLENINTKEQEEIIVNEFKYALLKDKDIRKKLI